MDAPWYANWSFWLYAVTALPFALFVVLYGIKSPWRDTAVGRALMYLSASIVAVLAYVLVARVVGDFPGRDWVRFVLLGSVSAAGFYQLGNLLRLLGEAEESRRNLDHSADRETGA